MNKPAAKLDDNVHMHTDTTASSYLAVFKLKLYNKPGKAPPSSSAWKILYSGSGLGA